MLLMEAAVESQQTRRICNKRESFNQEGSWDVWLPDQIGKEVAKGENIEIPLYMIFSSFLQFLKAS